MTKVYLTSEGSYSGFHITGVFSTREKAERAKEVHDYGNEIDEYDLDVISETPPGLLGWIVTMDENGDVKRWRREGYTTERPPVGLWMSWGIGGSVAYIGVWARDPEHAVKIASEIRHEKMVSGEWSEGLKKSREERAKLFERKYK
jgi:hypothetical protein